MIGAEPLEFRGHVYSTGGEDDALTIGNYLRHYNSQLEGQCTGTTAPLSHNGKV
jgi:small subunit ribosomal protein S29e